MRSSSCNTEASPAIVKAQHLHGSNSIRLTAPSPSPHDPEQSTPPKPTPTEEEDEWLVSCRCSSARFLTTLLSCLESVGRRNGEKSHKQHASSSSSSLLQPVTVFCSPTNLTFHVHGKSQQMQASVDLPASLLDEYTVLKAATEDEDEQHDDSHTTTTTTTTTTEQDWHAGGEFSVNLTTLLECLQLLGKSSSHHNNNNNNNNSFLGRRGARSEETTTTATTTATTQLSFSYNLTQELLTLELFQKDVLCRASIPGMQFPHDDDDDDNNNNNNNNNNTSTASSLALAFRSSEMQARMILSSHLLQHVATELQLVPGASVVTVSLSQSQGLVVAVVGHLGECCVSIPPTQVVSLQLFSGQESADGRSSSSSFNYPLGALLASWKHLELAHETCLTMNARGMMAIQHQVLLGGGTAAAGEEKEPCFVDFILSCLQEDDDDNDDETSSQQTTQTSAAMSTQISNNNNHELSQDWTQATTSSLRQQPTQVPFDHMEDATRRRQPRDSLEDGSTTVQSSWTPNSKSTSKSRSWWGGAGSHDEHDSDDDSNNGNYQRRRPGSSSTSSSLFPTARTSAASRHVRRRTSAGRQTLQGRHQQQRQVDDSEDDDQSRDLLQEEEEESAPLLDVTAHASPPRRRHNQDRDDDCSSPELVYGR